MGNHGNPLLSEFIGKHMGQSMGGHDGPIDHRRITAVVLDVACIVELLIDDAYFGKRLADPGQAVIQELGAGQQDVLDVIMAQKVVNEFFPMLRIEQSRQVVNVPCNRIVAIGNLLHGVGKYRGRDHHHAEPLCGKTFAHGMKELFRSTDGDERQRNQNGRWTSWVGVTQVGPAVPNRYRHAAWCDHRIVQ